MSLVGGLSLEFGGNAFWNVGFNHNPLLSILIKKKRKEGKRISKQDQSSMYTYTNDDNIIMLVTICICRVSYILSYH